MAARMPFGDHFWAADAFPYVMLRWAAMVQLDVLAWQQANPFRGRPQQ